MIRKFTVASLLSCALLTSVASAEEALVISTWGGSFRDLIDENIGKEFTRQTGVPVKYITGGTIDRLNKAKLSKTPESDITFTTSHIGWLYADGNLFEKLDTAKLPNYANLVEQARISPFHVGSWAYVYTIGYRPDLVPKDITFESWNDLWNPALKAKLSAPDFDPSHIINVAALLSGGDASTWEKGTDKLRALKPNFKAFYTNDANSQQLIATGETPVQVLLSMNAYYMIGQGVPIKVTMPKEGAVLGVDTMGIMKGTTKTDLAYKFMDIALSPEVQSKIVAYKKASPVVTNAKVSAEDAALPGVFTTKEQWEKQAIIIDHKLRAEKTAEWRKWFTENIMN
ncbi:ABC transporter, periplasmic spermidine putrescine-binding protein PotD (TC 3.A.1.11.1) [plant metagenome]|uniref:ABC transporter, periplasmic spermidine putrescine-binding protein PotD (TC 3.A.1.11.1) n=2 Tax=root TaxID=1 RepID=A0A1C3K5G1_9BURK|nr:polyamine ABC transporter substrate-binding protein [Orrella dioscoreae]SBT26607.1 ABC transporter, periplasmic spermidine putrescine-binding protein PotD (TC 3.A.1.11.1) [Orrella dioscoreae]SOE47149.1 ABC transporter, periplasmic spermidine putrescine-binding protein PotD (TC 3.A.1.11.1) [Orrella dioscoreae]